MVYHCSYGTCKNDTRHKDRPHMEGVSFHFFPNPTKEEDKCRRWVHACGRKDFTLQDVTRTMTICSQHFVGGHGPTKDHTDPIPLHFTSSQVVRYSKKRKAPAERSFDKATFEKSKHEEGIEHGAKCDKEDGSNGNNMHSFNDYQEFQILKKKKCSGLLRAILTSSLDVEVEERETNNQAQGADVAISAADVASASNSDSKAVQVDFACSDNVRLSIEKKILQKEVHVLHNQKEYIKKTPGKVKKRREAVCSECKKTIKKKDVNTDSDNGFLPAKRAKAQLFDIEWLLKLPEKFFFYTGLTPSQFQSLWNFVEEGSSNLKMWGFADRKIPCKLSSKNQILLTLIRLRRGYVLEDVATLFNINRSTASRIFITWIQYLYHKFKDVNMFPSRDYIQQYMTPKSMRRYKNLRCIIDCTEIFCQSSADFRKQGNKYSHYKNHATHKVLVGIAPNGTFIYISDVFEGSISDIKIVQESGFLEFLNPVDSILADRGFPIKDILASKQVKLVMPPFLGNREKFTPEEELLTRQIAKDRIHVERAIERLKRFRILKHQVNSQLDSMISQIVFVVACLVNFYDLLVT
ncbi:nuclease harbi1 [Plakobranchus ocellatus]|uniref:Nuclease harbi1 n=1 Tax=Plakobranchus ocellatus TaxID=259542 RepID=A0AAV4D5D7_9GAST|nr:nuclease harbi1 [Plakobranchus ocellatus]